MNIKNVINNILDNPYLNLVSRILIGLLFIFAAVPKIADPALFAKEIGNYGIIPFFFLNIMSLTLPWVELICGIFLMSGLRLKTSSAISIFLYTIFTLAVAIALIKGLSIKCGCHTKITADNVGIRKIIENCGLLLLCIYIFFYPAKKLTVENLILNDSENSKTS